MLCKCCTQYARSFLYSSVYSCYLFLISSAFVRSILLLSFIVIIFAWCSLCIFNFLEKISSLSHSIAFLYFFALFYFFAFLSLLAISGTLHSVGYTVPFLPCFSLLSIPLLFVKPPQTTALSSRISLSLEWLWSLPSVQCYEPLSIVLLFKGTFHARMGMIKEKYGKDLTEAVEIKHGWQEYTEELYKKRSFHFH